MFHNKNRKYSKLHAELLLALLKKYGPLKNFRKLIGKSFAFKMKSYQQNGLIINFDFSFQNETIKAVWRGKEVRDYLMNEKYKAGKLIYLNILDVDYLRGHLILGQKDKFKQSKAPKKMNRKTQETDLGIKLREALEFKKDEKSK